MTEEPEERPADKRMKLRYAGVCRLCGNDLPAGADAVYERATKTVRCVHCPPCSESAEGAPQAVVEPASVDTPRELVVGVAGASARHEYERRKAKDEECLRQKWGKLGGIAVALSDERHSTKAWATGAVGEERLGARLDSIASESIAVLHDRRIPGTRSNIDHIVVTTGGVWVIDTKRYRGRPELKVEGGIVRPRVEKLFVGRRNCTKLVDGVLKQVGLVRDALGDVPIRGSLCFVEADWPLIGGAFATRGVQVLWPKRLARHLVEAKGSVEVAAVREALVSRFKSA